MAKTVLVTGASTGIGAACCVDLARRGWRVMAGMRRPVELGEGIRSVALDVTEEGSIAAAAREVGEELAGVVNNAGIAVNGPLEFVRPDDLRRQLEVNVVGLVAVTQAMLPMLRRGKGRIVCISSVSGRVAFPYLGPYAASKHAVEAIGDAWRVELSPWGIRVALIEPGPIATPIWGKAIAAAEEQKRAWPAVAGELYPEYFGMVAGKIAEAEREAAPVGVVTEAVWHALTARRPKTRYLLGPGSTLAGLRRFIPDRVWDGLVRGRLRGYRRK